MVENTETRSHSPRQPLRHSYTLADGQRIPVLFRMKNIQNAAVAGARISAVKSTSQTASAEANVKSTQAPITEVPVTAPEPTLAGPSWLRRNAYRFTVAVLLIVTFVVLSSNDKQHHPATKVAKNDIHLEAPVVELAVAEPIRAPQAVVAPEPQAPVAVLAPKVDEKEVAALAPPALAQSDSPKANQGAIVETTESQASTTYLISKPAAESATNLLASTQTPSSNESGLGSSPPLAATTLLAPKTLAKPAEEEAIVGKPPVESNNWNVPVTEVSANSSKGLQLHASNKPTNRFTAPSNDAWQGSQSSPQSTDDPNLDPSMLFAIKKNYQANSLEQTVRDMRQQAQTQVPTPAATPGANQWQAIPASSALPSSAFAPRNNMALQNPGQPPANPFNPQPTTGLQTPTQAPLGASNVPQAGTSQNIPRRTSYQPVGPSLGLPTDTSLYPTATTPDGPAVNVPTKREPYKAVYGQQDLQSPSQPAPNYGSPFGTNNNLYESADQSFMGN